MKSVKNYDLLLCILSEQLELMNLGYTHINLLSFTTNQNLYTYIVYAVCC